MPGFDRRGPEGRGPMTGRRLGYCATDRQLHHSRQELPASRQYMDSDVGDCLWAVAAGGALVPDVEIFL